MLYSFVHMLSYSRSNSTNIYRAPIKWQAPSRPALRDGEGDAEINNESLKPLNPPGWVEGENGRQTSTWKTNTGQDEVDGSWGKSQVHPCPAGACLRNLGN